MDLLQKVVGSWLLSMESFPNLRYLVRELGDGLKNELKRNRFKVGDQFREFFRSER